MASRSLRPLRSPRRSGRKQPPRWLLHPAPRRRQRRQHQHQPRQWPRRPGTSGWSIARRGAEWPAEGAPTRWRASSMRRSCRASRAAARQSPAAWRPGRWAAAMANRLRHRASRAEISPRPAHTRRHTASTVAAAEPPRRICRKGASAPLLIRRARRWSSRREPAVLFS